MKENIEDIKKNKTKNKNRYPKKKQLKIISICEIKYEQRSLIYPPSLKKKHKHNSSTLFSIMM